MFQLKKEAEQAEYGVSRTGPLWRFKAALEDCCPGSIIEIDCKKINGKMYFSRMFVAIRACIDGFMAGCRPYLGVDSTHLTGKYKGQLATATAIDGHN